MSLPKSTQKKAYARKRRYYRRKPKTAVGRAISNSHKIKYFTETMQLTDWTITNAGVYQSFAVNLNQFINSVQYENLFDQFTVVKFSLKLIPRMGSATFGTSPAPALMAYCLNRDGQVGPPSSTYNIIQNDRAKTLMLDGRRIINIHCSNPKPYLVQNDNTGTAVLVQQPLRKWTWLDVVNGKDTNFHGIQIAIETASSTPAGVYTPMITATFAFKDQH